MMHTRKKWASPIGFRNRNRRNLGFHEEKIISPLFLERNREVMFTAEGVASSPLFRRSLPTLARPLTRSKKWSASGLDDAGMDVNKRPRTQYAAPTFRYRRTRYRFGEPPETLSSITGEPGAPCR